MPPRLTERVMARRAASIWRLVIQAGSVVASPKSPNATEKPPLAWPDMRPRITLRCLTRRGMSMGQAPAAATAAAWAGVSSRLPRSGAMSPR